MWQPTLKVQKPKEIILTLISKIRHVCALVILSIKIISNEGFVIFLSKIKEKIRGNLSLEIKNTYDLWILKNEPTKAKLRQYKKDIKYIKYQPKISIIISIFNPDLESIKNSIDSIVNQIYENWELFVVDGSTKEEIEQYLVAYENRDPRIKVKCLTKNSSFSNKTSEALGLTNGEFITFLDQHSELAKFALFEIITLLNKDNSIDLIYSDNDEISVNDKKRVNPHFKPDWSPDTLRSYNYIGNFIILRKKLLEETGSIGYNFNYTKFYDLILRTTEKAIAISHIPKILYHQNHQRISSIYTPFLSRNSKELRETILSSFCHTKISENENKIKFSLIILNKNAPEYIIPLLDSLKNNNLNKYYEIIVGDTGTTDKKVLEYYRTFSTDIIVVKGLKYQFSNNYNYLINTYAKGEIVGIMNNDIILKDTSFLHRIENVFLDDNIGAVGTKLLYEDGRLQHGGIFFFEEGHYKRLPYHRLHGKNPKELPDMELQDIPAVTGAFMFCRRVDFISVCGFDENYEEEAQDIDLCLKFTRSGRKITFLNLEGIIHIENGTRTKGSENWKDRNYFLWKWTSFLDCAILFSDLNKDIWSNKI